MGEDGVRCRSVEVGEVCFEDREPRCRYGCGLHACWGVGDPVRGWELVGERCLLEAEAEGCHFDGWWEMLVGLQERTWISGEAVA